MGTHTGLAARGVVVTVAVLVVAGGTAFASWGQTLAAGSSGYAGSAGLPAQVATITAACTTSTGATVKVTFSTVTGATSYTIWDAAAANGVYTVLAANVTGTPYTTPSLTPLFTYYFEVQAVDGTWGGARSAASSPGRTIGLGSCS